MYEVLGNRQAQQDIRARTPDAKHCELLMMSAHACKGCKNNPHEADNQAARELANMNAEALGRAYELLSDLELGLASRETLSPFDVTLLRIIFEHRSFKRQEIQAKLIAAQVAKLF
jgi:hypothetical protein